MTDPSAKCNCGHPKDWHKPDSGCTGWSHRSSQPCPCLTGSLGHLREIEHDWRQRAADELGVAADSIVLRTDPFTGAAVVLTLHQLDQPWTQLFRPLSVDQLLQAGGWSSDGPQ